MAGAHQERPPGWGCPWRPPDEVAVAWRTRSSRGPGGCVFIADGAIRAAGLRHRSHGGQEDLCRLYGIRQAWPPAASRGDRARARLGHLDTLGQLAATRKIGQAPVVRRPEGHVASWRLDGLARGEAPCARENSRKCRPLASGWASARDRLAHGLPDIAG